MKEKIMQEVKNVMGINVLKDPEYFWQEITRVSKKLGIQEKELPKKLGVLLDDLKNNWSDERLRKGAKLPKTFRKFIEDRRKFENIGGIFWTWINIAPKSFFDPEKVEIAKKILKKLNVKTTTHLARNVSLQLEEISEALEVKIDGVLEAIEQMQERWKEKTGREYKPSEEWIYSDLMLLIRNITRNLSKSNDKI